MGRPPPVEAPGEPSEPSMCHERVEAASRCKNFHPFKSSSPATIATVLLAAALLGQHPGAAEAGLIHIYHKYTPQTVDQMNQSSSSIDPSVHLQQEQDEQASIEYSSPMKRIMDLIGHHAPVIVVNSDGQADQTIRTPTGGGSPVVASSQQQLADQQPQQQQQHWAILDTGQVVQQVPQQMAAQQQQLIQSSVPFEQYYTFAPSQIATDQAGNQIALLPAGAFQQQLTSLPFGLQAQTEQNNPQPAPNFQENQVQPVFLSSYVPELPVQSLKPTSGLQQAPAQAAIGVEQQPNSIQQIQQQQQEEENPGKRSELEEGDPEQSEKSSENSDEPASDEEDSAVGKKKSRNRKETNDPDDSGIGSEKFEDKYDSDRDGEPSASDEPRLRAARADVIPNALIGVGLNEDCLQCICRASSGCDHLLRCITRGADETHCGPFQLTEEYWNRAGSPKEDSNSFQSFEDCANDPECAVETVTKYMRKYLRDCDSDGLITCMDYARLHRLGPNECHDSEKLAKIQDGYWAKFQNCADGVNRTRNGDDESI